jgi:hypothetical protein
MLKAAGAVRIYLAGRKPDESGRAQLEHVSGCISPRCNALAILQDAAAAVDESKTIDPPAAR